MNFCRLLFLFTLALSCLFMVGATNEGMTELSSGIANLRGSIVKSPPENRVLTFEYYGILNGIADVLDAFFAGIVGLLDAILDGFSDLFVPPE